MMKAAVFHGVNDVRVEDRDIPVPGDGEVLLQVKACAICGTDVRIIRNGHKTVKPPAVIGHEFVGVVADTGAGVTEVGTGDSVVVVTPVGCQECKFCRAGFQNMCNMVSKDVHSIGYYCDGGFSEYMLMPSDAVKNGNLIKFDYDGSVTYDEISLVEPLSCVINGQEFLGIKDGESVVIFGCGAIGCMHAIIAKAAGAAKIIMADTNMTRIDMVAGLRIADDLVCAKEPVEIENRILGILGETGADNVIVACSSSEAQKSAFKVSGIRGRISLFAGVPADMRMLNIDANDIHYLEKSVYGAFASPHHQYENALKMILDKKVSLKRLISQTLPLDRFNEGIEMLTSGEVFKVVIKPEEVDA